MNASRTVCCCVIMLLAAQSPALPTAVAQETTPAVRDKGEPSAAVPDALTTPKTSASRAKGFFEILFSGGPIGVIIMVALISLSLTAAYLVFDNILSLRKRDLLPEQLAADVRSMLAVGEWNQAQHACQAQPSLLAFVMNHGLGEIEGGWTDVEKGLEESLAEQSARLYRKVEYLSVIGSLAPMLGLLGTVTGMLMAFQNVATSEGKSGPADLAEGIYQALVTTVVGLIIAIPSLGAFAVLRNRVDQLVAEAAYMVQHAFAPLKRRGTTPVAMHAAPTPPLPPAVGAATTGASGAVRRQPKGTP